MKLAKLILTAALASGLGSIAQQAYAVNLPTCINGSTCLEFGDFDVYSLALLNQQATGNSAPGPGDPFYAPSTFGAIKNDTILGINNGQSTQTGNPTTTTDGAFNTPSPNNATSVTFSTATAGDPTGGPAVGDKATSWDSTVGALQTLIGGATKPLVAFFAFNETGSGTGRETTDLLIWAKVTLFDYNPDGSLGTNGSTSFWLSGDGSKGAAPDLNALPVAQDATQATVGPWVYVHAGICVSNTTNTFIGFPVNGQCPAGSSVKNQNNLGQNAASFAITSPELDAALQSGKYNVFSLDWEMAYINGGGETAWIMPAGVNLACPPDSPDPVCHPIPEPMSLALLGIGLLGLGVSRISVRRRRS